MALNTGSRGSEESSEKESAYKVYDVSQIVDKSKTRVLTGMRPSGRLHLGHYFGALENWIQLEGQVDCQFLIADYHVLGERVEEIEKLRQSVIDVATDWLAVGLDPEKSDFVVQSYVPESAELSMFFSMLTPYQKLALNPTLKAEMEQMKENGGASGITAGFFGYPISQAADILLPQANLVPVGEDQLPHIELTRWIARRFNRSFANIFPLPQALISAVPRLVGVDGKAKMSKSLDNAILLSDDSKTLRTRVMKMYTDPTRLKATDPGHLEGNVVFMYLDIFEKNAEALLDLKTRYQEGRIGDVAVKDHLFKLIDAFLEPIRERRVHFENNPSIVSDALDAGSDRARQRAQETMAQVKDVIGITRY